MSAVETHPTAAELGAFALGTLDDSAQAAIEDHLQRCPACLCAAANAPPDPFIEVLRTARHQANDTPPALSLADTFSDTPVPATELRPPADLLDHPRYRLRRPLGVGGMGAVWLAEHTVMGRLVALKVIRPDVLARPGAVERFRREARAAASLDHPNIVRAYDAEQAGETHLLAMEFVAGETLAARLARTGPLPPAEACRVARDVALALQHAHQHGLVHRDLKPHNLMISDFGLRIADWQNESEIRNPQSPMVKILDFGLAALASRADDGLTRANMVVGTPDYIAPEQAEDPRAADARSDIYSLGCTLYQMLTGRVPFPGDSVLRKLDAHRGSSAAPLPAKVPSGLAAVVTKMMAKRPADRYQSAAEVAAVLAPFAVGDVAPVLTRSRLCGLKLRSRKRLLVAVALMFFFFGLVVAAGIVLRIQTNEGEVVITAESPDVQILLLQGGKEVQVIDTKTQKRVTVPIGDYDVNVKDKPEGIEVKTERITVRRGKETLVTIERVAAPAPPGRAIAADFGSPADDAGLIRSIALSWWGDDIGNPLSPDGKLMMVPLEARKGIGRLLIEEIATGKRLGILEQLGWEITAAAFTADAKGVVFAVQAGDEHAVHLGDVASGQHRLLHRFDGADQKTVRWVGLSANGQQLAYTRQGARSIEIEAGVVPVGPEGKMRISIQHSRIPTYAAADGRLFVSVARGPGGNRSEVTVYRYGLPQPAKYSFSVDDFAATPFISGENLVGAICSKTGEGRWVETWDLTTGKSWRHKVGALDSTAAFSDGRGRRVAVLMGDRTIRVEDVGGWTVARFVAGPFERFKGCWLSANGTVMAVQTDIRLHLYRLPPLIGVQ